MKPAVEALIRALEKECNIKLTAEKNPELLEIPHTFHMKDGIVTMLNLKGCSLKSTPPSLTAFINLEYLNLEDNKISDIVPLVRHTKLRHLNLSSNNLTDISPLFYLTDIETLDLSFNHIAQISCILYLTGLRKLNLANNQITTISPLKNCKKLEELTLDRNEITDVSYLRGFSRLRMLSLQGIQSPLLIPFGYMPHLETLDLTSSRIKYWPFSFHLNKLTSIQLEDCDIHHIDFLKGMPNLSTINLSGNKIKDIRNLQHLKKLQTLGLAGNQIENIMPLLAIAGHLEHLDLSYNAIKVLPRWLFEKDFRHLAFEYFENPIENIPPEILKLDKAAVLNYLDSIGSTAQPINEIKVILLGEGSAGKTSMLNYLRGLPFNPMEPQTHGINLQDLKLGNGVTIKLWDFGGQDIMHHTHQFFLTPKGIYVLLLNARENNDTEKWLKLIQVFGGDSPVIIVTNKIDQNPSAHENIKYLSAKYPNIHLRYVKVSCHKQTGLEDFKKILTDTINELVHVKTLWAPDWLQVKKKLEAMRKEASLKDYIHYDKYEELCDQFNVDTPQRETLIKWLHRLGVITCFSDHGLNETHVINPSWLTEAFYAIINSEVVAAQQGKFHVRQLEIILPRTKYPAQKHAFLLNLMKKFELCYQIDDENYILPDLLSKEEPDFDFPSKGLLTLKLKYKNLLPKSVLPKFMARRHQEIHQDVRWRTGLVITNQFYESICLIRQDQEDKEITVNVHGREKRGYLAGIVSDFEKINKLYEGLEYEIGIRCSCPVCRASEKPFYFDYNALVVARDHNNEFHLCSHSGQTVRINELLGILMTRREMEKEIEKLIGSTAYMIRKSVENGVTDELIRIVQSVFSSVSYLLADNSERSYHVPLHVMLRAIFGSNVISDEMQAAGRADIVLKTEHYIYIFEIKLDGSSIDAIDQIHHKKYYQPHELDNKKFMLVGLNFSSKTRNIQDYRVETRDPLTV